MPRVRRKPAPKPETPPAPESKEIILQKSAQDLRSQREKAIQRLGLDVIPIELNLDKIFAEAGGFHKLLTDYVPYLAQVDPKYSNLLKAYETASKPDKRHLRPEDYLAKAGIPPHDFVGEMARIIFQLNADVGSIVAAVNHPDIVQAAVKSAKRVKGGQKDREMLFKATKFLPMPKGAETHIHFDRAGTDGNSPKSLPSPDESLPSFESVILEADKELRRERDSAPEVVDAEFEDVPPAGGGGHDTE